MNTTEGNKLIAEFMGAKKGIAGWGQLTIPPYGSMSATELKYHTSWDWLMPVVEKISDLDTAWQDDGLEARSNKSGIVLSTNVCVSIETLWKRIVEFITWHNSLHP